MQLDPALVLVLVCGFCGLLGGALGGLGGRVLAQLTLSRRVAELAASLDPEIDGKVREACKLARDALEAAERATSKANVIAGKLGSEIKRQPMQPDELDFVASYVLGKLQRGTQREAGA